MDIPPLSSLSIQFLESKVNTYFKLVGRMQRFDLGKLFCLERPRDEFCSRITNKATDSAIVLDFQWLWFKYKIKGMNGKSLVLPPVEVS